MRERERRDGVTASEGADVHDNNIRPRLHLVACKVAYYAEKAFHYQGIVAAVVVVVVVVVIIRAAEGLSLSLSPSLFSPQERDWRSWALTSDRRLMRA